jgi:lipoate synthase
MVILNKTSRFCPACELVIGHQDEIEGCLTQHFAESAPEVVGNDYLVVGTVEREDWRRGLAEPLTNAEMLAAIHDFKDHLHFKLAPRWEYRGAMKDR